jgi:hypothetical protein
MGKKLFEIKKTSNDIGIHVRYRRVMGIFNLHRYYGKNITVTAESTITLQREEPHQQGNQETASEKRSNEMSENVTRNKHSKESWTVTT